MSDTLLIVPTTNAEQLLNDMINGAELTSVYELRSITKPAKLKYWLKTEHGRFMVPNSAVEALVHRHELCQHPLTKKYYLTRDL